MGHTFSIPAIQLCCSIKKAITENTEINGQTPIKFICKKHAVLLVPQWFTVKVHNFLVCLDYYWVVFVWQVLKLLRESDF